MRYLVKNKNTIMFAFAILLCAIIASCEDAKYDTIGSRIYLAESSSLSYESKKVTVAEEGSVVTVTPRSGQIATKDIEVTLGLSPKSLEVYNTKSGTNYKSMPEGSYSFDQKTVVIKKGELVAPTVKVTIDPLTKEMLDSGDKFALPVAITAVSTNFGRCRCDDLYHGSGYYNLCTSVDGYKTNYYGNASGLYSNSMVT